MSEELTAAPVAALDLVADQNRAILLAGSCQTLGKLLGGELDAAHTLNALQDDGTDVALLQLSLPGGQVVHRQIGHVAVGVDGGDNLRIVGHLYGETCAPVEGLLGREHARAAIGKRGQLQCVLVGLGTAVDEKQLVVVVARDAAQSLGQLHLQLVHHGVRVEPQLADLFCDLLDIVRMDIRRITS